MSHKMGVGKTGPWIPDVEDHANISETPLAVQLDVARPVAEDQTKHDDIQSLGSYSVGGSSGSGIQRSSSSNSSSVHASAAASVPANADGGKGAAVIGDGQADPGTHAPESVDGIPKTRIDSQASGASVQAVPSISRVSC